MTPIAREDEDPGCAGECNYVLRRVERLDAEGRPVLLEVETCTGCGREIATRPIDGGEVSSPDTVPPASTC